MVILGFNRADDRAIALQLMREHGVTFPNVLDSSDAAWKVYSEGYKGDGAPLHYLIDREGKVVDAWYGYEKGEARALNVLEQLEVKS